MRIPDRWRRRSRARWGFAAALAAAWVAWGGAHAEPPRGARATPLADPPLLAELIERADHDRLHEEPQWLALLHYERSWLPPGRRSPILTPSFFLSDAGHRDPRAELHATLRALFAPATRRLEGQHPQCAFAARRHWLGQQLELGPDALPSVACPELESWLAGFEAKGLSLIFPEAFVNSPASMFGHTLLRVDVTREGGPEEMVGYAVDFTADPGGDKGLAYMARGVLGSYPAQFGISPYYDQLKRYAEWENRDIWEYRLSVDAEELRFLLMHLWELRGVEFPYYFFTQNCSFGLLRLLEIGVVELDASAGFWGPVIPVDTVRAVVDQPGLLESAHYRPSPETRLRAELRALSRRERQLAREIAEGRVDPEDASLEAIPAARRARLLELAYEQLRYAYLAGDVGEDDSRGRSRRILLARARLSTPEADAERETPEIEVPSVRPDQGHDSSLFSLTGGWRDEDAFIDLQLRPALHDLMDNGGGQPEHMGIRLLDTRMRIFPKSGNVRLQELTLVEATSLNPRSAVFKPFAWSFGTGLRTRRVPDDRDLDDAKVWGSHFGFGLAWDPHPDVLVYGLADARLDVGGRLDDDVSFGPGARVGVYAGSAEARWRVHLFGGVTRFAAGDRTTWIRGGGALRVATSRNTGILLESSVHRLYRETWYDGRLRLNLYFSAFDF